MEGLNPAPALTLQNLHGLQVLHLKHGKIAVPVSEDGHMDQN